MTILDTDLILNIRLCKDHYQLSSWDITEDGWYANPIPCVMFLYFTSTKRNIENTHSSLPLRLSKQTTYEITGEVNVVKSLMTQKSQTFRLLVGIPIFLVRV